MKYRSMYNSINQKLKAFPGETIVCLQVLTIANKSRVFPFYIDVLLLVEDNKQQYIHILRECEKNRFWLIFFLSHAPALVHDRTQWEIRRAHAEESQPSEPPVVFPYYPSGRKGPKHLGITSFELGRSNNGILVILSNENAYFVRGHSF